MKLLANIIAAASAYSSSSSSSSSDSDGPYWDGSDVCTGVYRIENERRFASPAMSGNPAMGSLYLNNLNCHYEIELDPAVTSFSIIAHSFNVESWSYRAPDHETDPYLCTGCSCDRLQIIDGDGVVVNFCGDANEENPPYAGNPLTTYTISGNTAQVSFITDDKVTKRGYEAEVKINDLPNDLAWRQIEMKAAEVSTQISDFYGSIGSKIGTRKVNSFNFFMNTMKRLKDLSSDEACAFPAGSNDHTTFVKPVDSDNACEELQGLFASLVSFTDSFVCLADRKAKPSKVLSPIHRQRKALVNRKLKQMKCGN
ncbi:Oidioi.mRNA.OKI2018_I69.chr1.g1638.t1.cds [Oikopleura dioica]|uniref:Oidioi.mRNA.OKI2018_I69.chr1.g1638.t1.cds n=1 Tax=Oikopleura dioica TaxID=34765 RepID=A0ABN7SSD0_OIKDI|nr:Oidioi.mRNA.OKI2018_I69.chr1.g1638.t1.cds [Oikopleura dioica]